ncbi:HAMP domain-containing histidine kinase [Bradyrhizobium niftali]|uniref:histidine kinase n=1 Tax=Bradyrhizobium niftali TaxID=2560055 RepID=A0A4Y9M881_9BRAD|nr:HAMP domain-containing histidine kinase [Bradyrhizobium niftali]
MAVQSGALASELANGAPGCRFERMLTTKKTGMGMGLIISRSIVEAHGGRICAENNSSLGGARFCVTLPVIARVKPAPDPAGAETPPAFASHRPRRSKGER